MADEMEHEHKQPFDYYLVLDVEATCDEERGAFPHEIIEVPVVVLNAKTGEIEADEFHAYVRPTERPELTAFCTELTGIQQEWVDKADDLETVLEALEAWLDERGLFTEETPTAFCSDGPWDFRDFFHGECTRKGIKYPWYMTDWVDLRRLHKEHTGTYGNVNGMLENLGMTFEGREHSGIDDARNIARIAHKLLHDGATLNVNRRIGRKRPMARVRHSVIPSRFRDQCAPIHSSG